MAPATKHKSVTDSVRSLEEDNVTIADWARSKDLALETVYLVVRGRSLGYRGEARRVLLAMGVQPPSRLVNDNAQAA